MISIIIPTLDEEGYLPLLLESIKKQEFSDYEIIIADAGSKDKTFSIAREYNCRIIPGGLPAKARNNGAALSRGDLLLFLDADVLLPDEFLERSLREFNRRKLQIATFRLVPKGKTKAPKLFFDLFYNVPVFFMQKMLPHAAMGILIDKKIFNKIKGFDETIKMAEDHDLARRAAKLGKYGVLISKNIFVSDRRFKTDGWLKTGVKYLFCEIYMIFVGPLRKDIFEYEFNHYLKKDKKRV